MARDLSKYTAEQQEDIKAQRRARAKARRSARAEARPSKPQRVARTTRQPAKATAKATGTRNAFAEHVGSLAFLGGGEGYDTTHEDSVLAEFGL